jgi:HPt (histidine-containing phosphotransfer) domain-containing protein
MDLPPSMYVNYLARRKADHARLTAAMGSPQGIDDFKTVGHQIKGNASSFGFNELVSIGEAMEKLSVVQLPTDGRQLLEDFWHWIISTEKRLERELAGADEK